MTYKLWNTHEHTHVWFHKEHLTNRMLAAGLPGRTPGAVKHYVVHNNMRRVNNPCANNQRCPKWTREEMDDLAKLYYAVPTDELLGYFPKRTRQAIQRKAYELRITKTRPKRHSVTRTAEQIAIVKQYYADEGVYCLRRMSEPITKAQLRSLAGTLGIRRKGWHRWTNKDIAILKKYYVLEGALGCCTRMKKDRSIHSIHKKAQELGVHNDIVRFTPEEIEIIKTYYPVEKGACIKRMPNREHVTSIYRKAKQLGLS